MTNDNLILIFIALSIMTACIARIINSHRQKNKLKQIITDRWGKVPGTIKPGKLKSISVYFYDKHLNEKQYTVDDITWNDLDIEKIFMRLNNTSSTVGEEYLYSLIREPVFDPEILNERERLIEFFRKNREEREKLQYILSKLGKVDYVNLSDYFLGGKQKPTRKTVLYNFLGVAALIAPVFMIFNFPMGLLIFISIFAVNMTLYYKSKNELGSQLEMLSYAVRLINCAKSILQSDIPELSMYKKELAASHNVLKGVSKKAFNLLYTSGDIFVEYAKIAYLREITSYESISNILKKHSYDLRNIYETVGLLDSLISIASFRESIDYWCIPGYKIQDAGKKCTLAFKDAYHPLIKGAVSNSLNIDKSILITGSNASGKSTFLKTTAINAILAQTINTCLAREYETCFFQIFSSMALRDDLALNESYYIAEIKSLKRIFESLNVNIPSLCIIDEVLRGTNTIERIAASSEVLSNLSRHNCICITATHDIELTRILEDQFINFHFQEKITENGIEFDYIIYRGRSNTRNAIKLLKFMGYDESIVTQAEKRAMSFISEGKWYA